MKTINWLGTYTLYKKEVRRFIKVYNQTLFAPVITALLFLAVFSLAVGGNVHHIADVPFQQFMASGLIIMSLVQNAFANSSSSFTMGKVLGTLIDYLMPPISAGEMISAMVFAAVTRGLIVGALVGGAVYLFIPLEVHHPFYALFYAIASSILLGLLGLLAGVLSESFDHMAAITSYVITPLSFLSGTFYSVKQLPPFWYHVSQFNPFFYMIDGFRYGMTGHHDGTIDIGIEVMIASIAILWTVTHILISRGYRIKS